MTEVESLIDKYVKCWNRPTINGIYEDNDFGCEHLQLIRNGFIFEDLDHDDISKLAALLTRELRGQINWDHKFFWAYCTFLTFTLRNQVDLFKDPNWQSAFANLTNLALSGRKWGKWAPWAQFTNAYSIVTQYVNNHLLETQSNKWEISAPLTCSILEGLMRRKNKDYVNIDGLVKNNFSILDANGKKRSYVVGNLLNRVNDSLRCFEQLTIPKRGRPCTCLPDIKKEFCSLYPLPKASDIYDMIDEWRNDLLHGNQYWMDKVPALLNLICLLIIDEVDPAIYDSKKDELKKHIQWMQNERTQSVRAPWDIFPPDL